MQVSSAERTPAQPFRILGLDAFRAVAVLAVLAFHVHPALLPGGFIGVDVFFVVSGFLITTLLLREHARTGRIDLGQFWVRRARRLLPALAVVVVISIAASLAGSPDLRVGILRQTLGALTFSTNWIEIAHGSSYFNHTSPVLFMNFWSLAVEEQFYLVWPLLFILVMKAVPGRRARVGLAATAALLSAVLMAVLVAPGQDATRAYYGTDSHSFGLFAGIALAFAWAAGQGFDADTRAVRQARRGAVLAGLAGLAACLALVTEDGTFTYRGGLFFASLATAALIFSQLGSSAPLQPVFESAPVRWVGERSYGIYLWHWPALKIVNDLAPAAPFSAAWWGVQAVAVALTFGAAAASARWIEAPIRRNGFRATWAAARAALLGDGSPGARPLAARIAAGVTAAAVLLAAAGIATAPARSTVEQSIKDNERLLAESQAKAKQRASSRGGSAAPAPPSPSPAPGDRKAFDYPKSEDILFLGDSIVSTSAQGIVDRFPDAAVDGVPNRKWDEAEALVKQHAADGTLPRAVVVDFGTNGGVPDAGAVTRVLDALGPDRAVVLMTIYGQSTFIDAANAAYRDAAKGRPNVIIGEWHAAVKKDPSVLQADGTHPDIAGLYLYGDVVKQAFHDLAERSGGAIPKGWKITPGPSAP
ncbi:acyltransferase family protein [Falsarthrobacter nasiphocae]|uniref:Peptidoglycan/LPS O-acetylase OafA/YrhL n=1 Tax=Falsarthrobacter nasiphocae TaxID=189863 RepID=A0AAE3YH90_9MICC|nr:acyltransferase family protein [Falsarthrobacter nasiphocae]MDR6892174.1 peptidoglycan/LPS O-acetylase OafA/YrhL [Falsarthrobacter nasiphocae]